MGLVAAGNVLSRLLGFVREPVIAAVFGATAQADAFEIATRVPNTLLEIAIGGAVSAVLVPLLAGIADPAAAARLFSNVATVTALLLGSLVGLGMLLAGPLVQLLAPDLSAEAKPLAVSMLRFTLPAALLLGLSAVVTARLLARESFLGPAFSVSSLNAVLVVSILALTPLLGPVAVAFGYLLGAGAHLLVQLPGLLRIDPLAVRPAPWRDPDLRRAAMLYLPVLAGLVVTQVVIMIDTRLASSAGEGSLAMMRFAARLQQFPLGAVVAAVALVLLPGLSRSAPPRLAGLPGAADFSRLLWSAARALAVGITPLAIFLVLASEPIVRVVFLRGQFVEAAVAPTALALVIYALALPLIAIDQLLIFAFYACRNTIVPAGVGVLGSLVYLAIAFPAAAAIGFHGLVWANTVQNSLHGLVLVALILYWLRLRPSRAAIIFLGKIALAGAAAAIALLVGAAAAAALEPGAPGLLTLALALPLSAAAYLGVLQVLGVSEPGLILGLLRARLGRGRAGIS